MTTTLPDTVYMGREEGRWPIHTFEDSLSAMTWLQSDPEHRKLWRVRVEVLATCEYVPPTAGSIIEHATGKAVRSD
jgi:hypothetical protein